MVKKSSSFCLFLFLFSCAYSQQNYLPGIIVKISGDTLHGLVNYKNSEKNPLNVYFRVDADHQPVIFSPRQIQSFRVGDEIYWAATVKLNDGFNETADLGYSPDISFRTELVFLQTLIKGSKSLFYYRDILGREQFFVELDSTFELLIYHKYLTDFQARGNLGGSTSIAEDKRFVGQLSYYLKDCPEIQTQLHYLKYSRQSLVRLFGHYYHCMNTEAEFEKKSDDTKAEFGLVAGLSLAKLKFNAYEDYYDEVANSDFPVSLDIAFGIFLNKKLARNLERFSIYNELFLSSYKTEAVYKDFINENRYEINYISFGGFYIKMNNMLQYTIPLRKISLFMRTGMANGWNINETNQKMVESVFYTTHREKTTLAINETRKYAIGILGGIGANYDHFSLDIRYEQNYGMSDVNTLKSSLRTFYFLVGYRL